MKINDIVYDSSPAIHKAQSSTGYTGKSMRKDGDISITNNFKNDLVYTDDGYQLPERKIFLSIDIPEKVAGIESKIVIK